MGNISDINKYFHQLVHAAETDEEEDNQEICHITYDTLDDKHIKLVCGHTFNYTPLFKEISTQKQSKSSYNILKLKVNQIQCPYCRNIQNTILPRSKEVPRVYGVNYPDVYSMKPDSCKYQFQSGKRKGSLCSKGCYGNACIQHEKLMQKKLNSTNTCASILKSGKNKGCKCGNKAMKNSSYCKRHYELNLSSNLSTCSAES
jgi:hypothetical protein